MTTKSFQSKIRRLESELGTLKRMIVREPDLEIDEKNWATVRRPAKAVRRSVYRDVYTKVS